VGRWSTKLKPIPVNDAVLRALLGADDIPAIAGVVVSLMEEDGWPDDLADTGYSAFVDAVQLAVVKVAASFQHALAAPTPQQIKDQIDVVKASAASSVKAAVKNAMSGWQLVWYGTFGDNDDGVGTEAFTTTTDELVATPAITINRRWSGDESGDGDWELSGVFRGFPQVDCHLESLFAFSSGGNVRQGSPMPGVSTPCGLSGKVDSASFRVWAPGGVNSPRRARRWPCLRRSGPKCRMH